MGKQRRRGSGEGTTTQRKDGRWMGQLSLGFNPVTGERLRETIYGDTQAEVRQKLDELKQRHRDGAPAVESKLPLSRYLDIWLAGVKDTLVERSYARYAQSVAHLNGYLGSRPVSQLTGYDVTRLYQQMAEDGHTAAARRYTTKLLRRALDAAVRMSYVRQNVAKQVPLPKSMPKEIRPLSPAEVTRFLDAVQGDRLFALYVVALDSGAREGELLALEWSDWSPAARELSFTRTLVAWEGKAGTRKPKTAASVRKVVLSEEAAAALEAHRARAVGTLVFPNKAGHYYQTNHLVEYCFRPALSRAGLPASIRFHDLRHTCATLLLMSGVDPKTVAERLGHSSTQQLFQTYGHVLPAMRQRAAAVMGGFFRPGSKVAVDDGDGGPKALVL